MTTTFADYAASAEARKNIVEAVLGHTYALCEALRQNFIDYSIKMHERAVDNVEYHNACIQDLKNGNCGYEFYPETGRKYHKIIMVANGSRSVHAFVDKKTGEIYKSASWKSPAKGVRYDLRIIEQREWLLENADWSGSYLYVR
jgi:phage pi2 protein 07